MNSNSTFYFCFFKLKYFLLKHIGNYEIRSDQKLISFSAGGGTQTHSPGTFMISAKENTDERKRKMTDEV